MASTAGVISNTATLSIHLALQHITSILCGNDLITFNPDTITNGWVHYHRPATTFIDSSITHLSNPTGTVTASSVRFVHALLTYAIDPDYVANDLWCHLCQS